MTTGVKSYYIEYGTNRILGEVRLTLQYCLCPLARYGKEIADEL